MKQRAESTLKRLTKDELIETIRCLENNVKGLEEMNANQFKLLMEKDKYAWHDLRKNPEDLPNEKMIGHGQVMYRWIGSGGCVWHDCGWFYNDNREDRPYFSRANEHLLIGDGYRNVIAWRYIEPFEEDNK